MSDAERESALKCRSVARVTLEVDAIDQVEIAPVQTDLKAVGLAEKPATPSLAHGMTLVADFEGSGRGRANQGKASKHQ
jgi:hypothetical protein